MSLGYVVGVKPPILREQRYFDSDIGFINWGGNVDLYKRDHYSHMGAKRHSMSIIKSRLWGLFEEFAVGASEMLVPMAKKPWPAKITNPTVTENKEIKASDLVIAHFELALLPADPRLVYSMINFKRVQDATEKMGYRRNISSDDWVTFANSIQEAPPKGFESAGYLVVSNKEPKYIADLSFFQPCFDSFDICAERPSVRDFKPFLLSLTDYVDVLENPEFSAQIMRAGIRVTPIAAEHCGLIYDFEEAANQGKMGAAESQRGIDAVLRLSRDLAKAKARNTFQATRVA